MMIDDKKRKFRIILEDCPVIAAVKDETGLKECLYSESQIIFLLFGDICSVGRYVEIAKSAGKMVFVHTCISEYLVKPVCVSIMIRI